jgi:hypothetical protein
LYLIKYTPEARLVIVEIPMVRGNAEADENIFT